MTIRAVERAFALLGVLRARTDESHPLTISQLEEELSHVGHTQARQSVIACLETLSACGYDVQKAPGSSPSSFYLGARELSEQDVETVADMLSASRYVTCEQAERIAERCSWALSDYERGHIACSVQVGARRTEGDVDWIHNARLVRRAVEGGLSVSFLYVDYSPQGVAVPRHGGKRYAAVPLTLVYTDGTYYMQATEDGVRAKTFRVDHMRSVELQESSIDASAARSELDIPKLTERTFSMFGAQDGRDRRVELVVEPDCIASVVDYFKDRRSCDMACADLDGSRMSVTVTVQPSPTFFGWVAQYLGGVRIVAPDDLRRSFAESVARLSEKAGA